MSQQLAAPVPAPVPAEPWERLYEAACRSLPSLSGRISADILAELTPENLWVLAVILAAWVGAHLVGGPVAWAADVGLAAAGLYAIGSDVVKVSKEFYGWASVAYTAKTQVELDQAAAHFGEALVVGGMLLLTTVLTTTAFKVARRLVLKVKPPRIVEKGGEPPKPEEASGSERGATERETREPKEESKGERGATERETREPKEESKGEREATEREPLEPKEESKDRGGLADDVLMGQGAALAARSLTWPWILSGLGAAAALAILLVVRRRRRAEAERG